MECIQIKDRECLVCRKGDPGFILILCTDVHDFSITEISEALPEDHLLIGLPITDWNEELSPWDAPAVFGRDDFGHGAAETLRYIEEELIPYFNQDDLPVILGGYSLAGLFSLWAAYQTDIFSAIAAVSPSVWFPGWLDYAQTHEIGTDCVYLSLGDKEEKTKNRIMATVGDCIRKQAELLKDRNCILEWNEGNHFQDPNGRCLKGFSWCIRNIIKRY